MMEHCKHLHVAAIGLSNVRFYRAPLDGPHMPWHAVDDLHQSILMDRKARRRHRALLVRDWGREARTVATDEGKALIASHIAAQGFLDAMVEVGQATAELRDQYSVGASEAMDRMTIGMGDLEKLNHAVAAFRNSNGLPGPHPEFDESAIVRRLEGDV